VVQQTYIPWGAAKKLFGCRDPEVLIAGPAGTGKSYACLMKLYASAFANDGARFLIVRKVQASLSSSALVTWRKHVIPPAVKCGLLNYYGGSAVEPPQYRFANGSSVMLGGMNNADRVLSTEYDMIYVQEATELALVDWETLVSRLRNGRISYQQIIADSNPSSEHHWIKQRCNEGKTTLFHSKHQDNPLFWDSGKSDWTAKGEAYLSHLRALTGVRRERLYEGRWVSEEGTIFVGFHERVHVIKPFVIPSDWLRYLTIDFGFTNPFVCQWWAIDTEGRAYMYREIYRTKRLVEDHAKQIQEHIDIDGVIPEAVLADHDAEGRATLEKYLRRSIKPARKDVLRGIEAVQSRFCIPEDKKPRLCFFSDSLLERDLRLRNTGKPCSTVEEIAGYVWSARKTESGIDQPTKVNDHGVDCIRYMIAHLDLRKSPSFLSVEV